MFYVLLYTSRLADCHLTKLGSSICFWGCGQAVRPNIFNLEGCTVVGCFIYIAEWYSVWVQICLNLWKIYHWRYWTSLHSGPDRWRRIPLHTSGSYHCCSFERLQECKSCTRYFTGSSWLWKCCGNFLNHCSYPCPGKSCSDNRNCL